MAKSYIDSMLGENERILLVTRQHWFVIFSAILGEILFALVVIVGVTVATLYFPIAAFGFALVLVPVLSALRDILIWNNHE